MTEPINEDIEPLNEGGGNMMEQMQQMEKLMQMQMQMMKMNFSAGGLDTSSTSQGNTLADTWTQEGFVRKQVRQVKVPEGRHNMSLAEFRTYSKDCRDYQFLTQYSDQQVVLQMRLNMDVDLKRAIDTNYSDEWDSKTVDDAIEAVGSIVNEIRNPAVYRKEFDGMQQRNDEPIREFVQNLKSVAFLE